MSTASPIVEIPNKKNANFQSVVDAIAERDAALHKNWFETERLILRSWTLADFDSYAALAAEPEGIQFLASQDKPLSRWDAWSQFAAIVGHWDLRGFGIFAVTDKSTKELIGRVGSWQPESAPAFEINWTLRRFFWGRGYATEAARACQEHAFVVLRQSHVCSLIREDNIRSIKVAERIGQHFEGKVTVPDTSKVFLKYGISRNSPNARWI